QHRIDLRNVLRRKGLSTATIHAADRVVQNICEEGRDRQVLFVDVRPSKRHRIVVENKRETYKPNADEARAIVKTAKPRWQLLFLTEATTGIRASEGLGLTWADLNLAKGEGSITISKQLSRDGVL